MKDVMQWRLRSGSALLYQSRTRDGSTLVVQIQYLTKRRVIDNPPLRSISTSHSLTSFPANKLITNKSTFRPKLARSSGSIANLSCGWLEVRGPRSTLLRRQWEEKETARADTSGGARLFSRWKKRVAAEYIAVYPPVALLFPVHRQGDCSQLKSQINTYRKYD